MTELDEMIANAEGMKRLLRMTLDGKCVDADACGRVVREHTSPAAAW